MTAKTFAAKAASLAIPFLIAAPAYSQVAPLNTIPGVSLTSGHGSGMSNHAILVASAIILLVGLADDDQALTIIGGVGVLISVADQGQFYRYSVRHDMFRMGPMSFGIAPYGKPGFAEPHPSPYVQFSFKF